MNSMVIIARQRLQEYRATLERLLSEPGDYDTETAKQALADTSAAIERINEGRYGTCERCGGAIGRQRLLALPSVRFCIACSLTERESSVAAEVSGAGTPGSTAR
jgi:hypothetical protein